MKARFAPLAEALTENEAKIVDELNTAQGVTLDLGGYFRPDLAKAQAAMRPSATFNAALAAFGGAYIGRIGRAELSLVRGFDRYVSPCGAD